MPDLVEIRMLGVPVAIWSSSSEHFQELIREFTLIAAGPAAEEHAVPARLLQLIDQLTEDYGSFTTDQEELLAAAADARTPAIDLTFNVPKEAALPAVELGRTLDEADEFCRSGEYLLTLAPGEEAVAYRRWYIDQFVQQIAGRAPVSWPSWRAGASA